MKKVLAMLLITAMVLGATGCSGGTDTATEDTAATTEDSGGETADAETDDAAAATGDTVKIGVLLPFSGASAATGELQMRGIQMYVDRVNENGGIQSLGGAQIELIRADTTGSPEVGVTEMERLIAENPDMAAIVGPYQSAVGSSTVPIAEKYGIPYMLTNCTTDNVLGE